MLPLRHARRWRVASGVMLVLVLAATLMPAVWFVDDKVRMMSWFRGADKWLHGITFLVLAVWFSGQYRQRSYWRIAIGLMAFGMLIELCQLMVGYRMAEWADIGANTAGIALGLAVAIAGVGGWCLRFEDWQLARKSGPAVD